jgi:DNA (cytosine-5)-methyltransferase 1
MEAAGYAFAALDMCAAGFGAPHIRQRLLFVGQSVEHHQGDGRIERGAESGEWSPERGRGAGGVADDESLGWLRGPHDGDGGRRECAFGSGSEAERLANSNGWDPGAERRQRGGEQRQQQEDGFLGDLDSGGRPCPVNGFWRAADWLFCTDGKWRPAQPGTQPLVDGASFKLGSGGAFEGKSRIKMLKGYGGAIVAPQATEFIKAAMEFLK